MSNFPHPHCTMRRHQTHILLKKSVASTSIVTHDPFLRTRTERIVRIVFSSRFPAIRRETGKSCLPQTFFAAVFIDERRAGRECAGSVQIQKVEASEPTKFDSDKLSLCGVTCVKTLRHIRASHHRIRRRQVASDGRTHCAGVKRPRVVGRDRHVHIGRARATRHRATGAVHTKLSSSRARTRVPNGPESVFRCD